MFKLLRRSKHKNFHKNKFDDVAVSDDDCDAEAATARKYTARAIAGERQSTTHRNSEQYRQFSESANKMVRDRVSLPCRRAVIEELDDFAIGYDDNSHDQVDLHDNGDDVAVVAAAEVAIVDSIENRKADDADADADGDADVDADVHGDNQPDEDIKNEKVNLATAAASMSAQDEHVAQRQGEFVGDFITRTKNIETNSAKQTKCSDLNEFSKADNIINKIFTATTTAKTFDGNQNVFSDERAHAESLANSGNSENSQNVDADWQRRTKTLGTDITLIGKYIKSNGRDTYERNSIKQQQQQPHQQQQFNSSSQDPRAFIINKNQLLTTTIDDGLENVGSPVVAHTTRTSETNSNSNSNSNKKSNSNSTSSNRSPQTSRTDIKNINKEANTDTDFLNDTVINEVKYRTNFDDNTHKLRKQSETKRQSRLSLTNLGLNLTNSEPNKYSTDVDFKQLTSAAVPKKNSGKFFSGSKSNKNQKNSVEQLNNTQAIGEKKLRVLQKSREFLTDIFMARGRNNNRNRQHQPHNNSKITATPPVAKPAALPANTHLNNVVITNRNNDRAHHLETNCDPVAAPTISYQMTASNNSNKRNVFSNEFNMDAERQSESECERNCESNSAKEQRTAAGAGEVSVVSELKELNQSGCIEHNVIHAANVEQNGVPLGGVAVVNNNRADRSGRVLKAAVINEYNAQQLQQLRNDLTECQQRDRLLDKDDKNESINLSTDNSDAYDIKLLMGQKNGKPEQSRSRSNSRASTPREFRESVITDTPVSVKSVKLPTITVVDYSDSGSHTSAEQSPTEQEVFYDFEHESRQENDNYVTLNEIEPSVIEALDDEVFETEIPITMHQQRWTRLSHVKLENVPEDEEDEEEEEAEEDDEDDEEEEEEDDDSVGDAVQQNANANGNRGIDNERYEAANDRRQIAHEKRASSERTAHSPLKSTNTSDSNLSTSYPDSGIGIDSQLSSVSSMTGGRQSVSGDNETLPSPLQRSATLTARSHLPFVRDGNSTDCDETLMQYDDLDNELLLAQHPHERLVCIESISLPDVVVESTTASNASSSSSSHTANGEQMNINISGAAGNSVGNVHFIPIHIEGSSQQPVGGSTAARSRSNSPKHRSLDDSVIGSDGKLSATATVPPTIEIVEDGSILGDYFGNSKATDALKQELHEQKTRLCGQLADAQKNVHQLEHKVCDMQSKIEALEQELSLKTWNVERLQSELSAVHKDDEFVRKKLKLLEDEKTNLRHKFSENEDEFRRKYVELETQYVELNEKYKQTQSLASSLQTQLAAAQVEAEKWRQEVDKIRTELEEQLRILRNALENSEAERKICEDKWQNEFEMLRTHNLEQEETLLGDCEWQLRQMQKQHKDKYERSENARKQAQERADELEQELAQRKKELDNLRSYQSQVNSLRGVVNEQQHSIQTLMEQIDNLTGELATANENLKMQIEAVRKIKYQCDNALYDKERQMNYRIDEVRNEAAALWENKLYTEMTRLKNELESVYIDERREALDKLQAEHIEELRALTTRYTANEEELRAEFEELQERFDKKSEEYLELREKSDSALLQTRMHLDRADREYQNAMCREEQRREALEEKLRKEFEGVKEEMEAKFRERLAEIKQEFAKELKNSTKDMVDKHHKELEQQKAKLQAERDEAVQELSERHRKKLAAAEEKINEIELRHQRDLNDLKAAYDAEKVALDKRDISNANEIEMLHRKCRCLTNLFEEMRMRYERRDPRPEDLSEIAELRTRCESQERDLYVLTDRLREMQMQMSELQQNGAKKSGDSVGVKMVKKPPPKTIPTSCDVIYEENEDRESPPPASKPNVVESDGEEEVEYEEIEVDEEDEDEDEDDDEDDDEEDEQSDTESNHKVEINSKNIEQINQDDARMITAV